MPDLLGSGLPAGCLGLFTTRRGGASQGDFADLNLSANVGDEALAVLANRRALAASLGVADDRLWFPHQVHGSAVALAVGTSTPGGVAVDALVTTDPSVGLAVLAADCLPILMVDPVAAVAAAAHAGRRGLMAGVLLATIDLMCDQGADPARISAAIGPAVCGGCYELPEAMVTEVVAALPGSRARTHAGRAGADLVAGARHQLVAAGVTQVGHVGGCTVEQPGLFFSYRRDGRTGRQAGAIRLLTR